MTDLFFPNQPPHVLEQEKRIRRVAADLPEAAQLTIYEALTALVPSLAETRFVPEQDMVLALQCGGELAFPRPIPPVKLCILAFGYREWLRRKYCLPGFVEVEGGDLVVDCGAYVGGFALSAAGIAREVHAFEPDSANASCARRNLAGWPNVKVVERGLYGTSREMILNVSANSVEHSLLLPDDGVVVQERRIEVVTLADYLRSEGIGRLDFLKLEAEGVELEVFAGLGEVRPRKIAIDVSPERNGQSPAAEFRARLDPLGYEVRQRGQVMFARAAAD